MKFKVLKSSLDGISGGSSDFSSIGEALREISHHKGWPTLKALHASIKRWAKDARPGSVYATSVSAIVAVAVDRLDREDDICQHCGGEGLDYGEMEGVEGGDVEQQVTCPHCWRKWIDVFSLSDQREIK